MCKGFHHCPSPWWWECSIRNRQLGDKQVDRRIIRTLTQRQAAVPISPIRNERSIAPRTIKGFKNQNSVAQFSRKTKTKTKPVLNLHLASQPYTESFQQLWETGTMWVNSQLLPSREGNDSVASLLDSWPQLKRQLFSTYGHNWRHNSSRLMAATKETPLLDL